MNQTSKSYLNTLRIIYFAMMASMILFGLVSFFLISTLIIVRNPDPDIALILRYVLFAVTPVSLSIGYFIFKQYLASTSQITSLKARLFRYQIAVLIRSACLEIPGMLGAACAFITGELSFLLFTAIMIMMFLMLMPGVGAIVQDLGLSQQEKATLENPDSILQ